MLTHIYTHELTFILTNSHAFGELPCIHMLTHTVSDNMREVIRHLLVHERPIIP